MFVVLNWREAQRTMLTEDTKDAILVNEAINEGTNSVKQLTGIEDLAGRIILC